MKSGSAPFPAVSTKTGTGGGCPWGKNGRVVKLAILQINQQILRMEKDGPWQKNL